MQQRMIKMPSSHQETTGKTALSVCGMLKYMVSTWCQGYSGVSRSVTQCMCGMCVTLYMCGV